MSWWGYVQRVSQTSRQRDIADRTGIDATNVTRWKGGQIPKAEMVAQFARGYQRPVLEAFVAAGFLTADEARERPSVTPTLDSLTDDQLLDEIRKRMAHDQAPIGAPRLRAAHPLTGEQSQGRQMRHIQDQEGEGTQ